MTTEDSLKVEERKKERKVTQLRGGHVSAVLVRSLHGCPARLGGKTLQTEEDETSLRAFSRLHQRALQTPHRPAEPRPARPAPAHKRTRRPATRRRSRKCAFSSANKEQKMSRKCRLRSKKKKNQGQFLLLKIRAVNLWLGKSLRCSSSALTCRI